MRAELENLPEAWPGNPTWFWHGEQVLDLIETYEPIVCVELGSWLGGSAIPVARLVRRWGGHVTCVDTWETTPATRARCWDNIVRAGMQDSITLIQSLTTDAARAWTEPIDFLYIDADHSYEGCKSDLQLWWPHLKVGGLIAGDDYDDPRWGVTPAWDEFEKEHDQVFERKHTPGSTPACTRLIWGVKCALGGR